MIIRKYNEFKSLNEGLSDVVYHFTFLGNALDIIKTNRLKSNVSSFNDLENSFSKNKHYFISTTRSKSMGFGRNNDFYSVKFKIDGRKISNNHKAYPMDYYKGQNDSNKELEDRILLNEPYLENFSKYISELHLYLNNYIINSLHKRSGINILDALDIIIEWCESNDIQLSIYSNFDDFKTEVNPVSISDIKKDLVKFKNTELERTEEKEYLFGGRETGLSEFIYFLSIDKGIFKRHKALEIVETIVETNQEELIDKIDQKHVEFIRFSNRYAKEELFYFLEPYINDLKMFINSNRRNLNEDFTNYIHKLTLKIKNKTVEEYVIDIIHNLED